MSAVEETPSRRMRLRYPGTCRVCGCSLAVGTTAVYERATRTVRCEDCGDRTPRVGGAGGLWAAAAGVDPTSQGRLLEARVSWRREAEVSRAYVWLTDGTVVGYRDLLSGVDWVAHPGWSDIHQQSLRDWLTTYRPPVGPPGPAQSPVSLPADPLRRWWHRRRDRRRERRRARAEASLRVDRPLWRIPIDPPHGGWQDLVRNEAGHALFEKAMAIRPSSFFDTAGRAESRAWHRGGLGEVAVADELRRITRGSAWRCLHAVPVGTRGADIDHVLVGPGGVVTLNTKAHQGARIWVAARTFRVNGQHHPYLRNSVFEAQRTRTALTRACGYVVPVTSAIVVVDPRAIIVKDESAGVAVMTRARLGRYLDRLPTVLDQDQIDHVFDLARRSTTWPGTGSR